MKVRLKICFFLFQFLAANVVLGKPALAPCRFLVLGLPSDSSAIRIELRDGKPSQVIKMENSPASLKTEISVAIEPVDLVAFSLDDPSAHGDKRVADYIEIFQKVTPDGQGLDFGRRSVPADLLRKNIVVARKGEIVQTEIKTSGGTENFIGRYEGGSPIKGHMAFAGKDISGSSLTGGMEVFHVGDYVEISLKQETVSGKMSKNGQLLGMSDDGQQVRLSVGNFSVNDIDGKITRISAPARTYIGPAETK